jgi:hypothetical protein
MTPDEYGAAPDQPDPAMVQRAIIGAVMEYDKVNPVVLKGRNTFDPNRLVPVWRV